MLSGSVLSFKEFAFGSIITVVVDSDPRENKSCTWGPLVQVRLDFFGRTVSCSGDEHVLSKLSSCSSNFESIRDSLLFSSDGDSGENKI